MQSWWQVKLLTRDSLFESNFCEKMVHPDTWDDMLVVVVSQANGKCIILMKENHLSVLITTNIVISYLNKYVPKGKVM